uniref:Uncharacterized protein n=1 Tax=Haptolina brevifila TaxID=156173 RepID=A0A7S2DKP5_9EUKA|mmetsp:Transcript_40136/g.80486  ORF Transcript_40136/g.80486 Transcript_40136/m.80486 type:complete len:230 (+) Transcript_40136:108-797(+)
MAASTGLHSERKLRVLRATRILQIFSLALLIIGGVNFIPIVGNLLMGVVTGILCAATGAVGIMGLSFTWHRALVLFTILSWATAIYAVVRLVMLGLNHSVNVWQWLLFLCTGVAALPPALLSSAMHLRRVWRPRPLIGEHSAPLVDEQAENAPAPVNAGAAPPLATPVHVPAMERPVWPPPNAPLALGKDLLATGRVAHAVQSGDASNVQPGDVHASARVAAAVWPPPS